ncbi:MAG: MSMEG_0567/Sll0786 family nitrogen starvation N-acetyltransferase [Acidimicrobiales bacterium]
MHPIESPFDRSVELDRPGRRPGAVRCRLVGNDEELALHLAIRRAVFVEEQHVFEADDRDDHDEDHATLHVLGIWGGVAAATVRLYPAGAQGFWVGDRLAVLPPFRLFGLGRPLVELATHSAKARGGTRMDAHVQLANVAFFERLGWARVGPPADYLELPHQAMTINLRHLARSSSPVPLAPSEGR